MQIVEAESVNLAGGKAVCLHVSLVPITYGRMTEFDVPLSSIVIVQTRYKTGNFLLVHNEQ